ncbi:MAG: GAF domain-containing protein [Chloroflexi bacterium]|nr:GAF domain-containing protein [Chloroflexota bacterium]
MTKFLEFFLLLLTQFAGGPGPKENNLVRFGLPALLWAALFYVAWSRQRRQELPREKLLVWGFGLGLARELFMFSHLAMQLIGEGGHEPTGYFAPEPLEHAMTMAAIVVVAGAFIQYILDDDTLARRYLRVGLVATGICYIITSWWWYQITTASSESKFNQSPSGFFVHMATSLFVAIAIILITRKRGWLRNTVAVALAFFFLGEFLRLCNFVTLRTYTNILCPVANGFHIAAIPLLGYVYLREQSIKKWEAEKGLAAYREHLEDLVEERTTELTQANEQLQREVAERERAEAEIAQRNTELAAQNAIAATTSQSLDLNTLLNTALDTVMAVLEMDVGSIFLLEPDGEAMTLRAHRGGITVETAVESVDRSRMNKCIAFQAVADMRPLLLNMPDTNVKHPPRFIVEEGLQTMASTPLVASGQTVGALNLGARVPHAIPSQGLELLTAIGQQIGIAVENAHLYRETERWAEELALLHEVSVFLTSTFDPTTIYNQMAEQSAKLLGCSMSCILRWDEERRLAVIISSYGIVDQKIDGLQMLLGESGILLDLVANRLPIAIQDAQTDPLVSSFWLEKFNIRALLCLPVWGKGKPLGFLCMIEPHKPRRWKPNEMQLVDSFINRAAIALENANLHRQLEWAATLEERQRIAADMHDGLAQTLSYMGHRIDLVTELAQAERTPDLLNVCDHIRDTIDQASREVRQSIASLQEVPLPKRSLQDWLTDAANEFTKKHNGTTAAALVTKLSVPLFAPPSHIEQVLHVVQEALANANHHAQAQQVVITLERQSDWVIITVEDDGQGFDPKSPPADGRDHFGLSIMRARAARINGQLEIDSSPGQGTRVKLTWSLESS